MLGCDISPAEERKKGEKIAETEKNYDTNSNADINTHTRARARKFM